MGDSLGSRSETVALAAVLAGATVLLTAAPAAAEFTATFEDLTIPPVEYSFQTQTVSENVVLTVSDTSKALVDSDTGQAVPSDGWNVTLTASPLRYSGEYGGTDISPAALTIMSTQAPVALESASAEVDPVGGPKVPEQTSFPASLDTPRAVLEAEEGYGRGSYTQGLTVSLTVPAAARTGTYTGIITTTISPGPIPS